MSEWRMRTKGALPVTQQGQLEIVNAICLAAFRHSITSKAMADALASFEEDMAEGRYLHADVLWRAPVDRAIKLSRRHTPLIGCRSLDVLRVATAFELGLPMFVTFDERQRRLARAAGLRLIAPAR